jgi:HAD superfamily hydrolase (TIGR01549 family)
LIKVILNNLTHKHFIFDFDGVLVDSNQIREQGFQDLFSKYPLSQRQQLAIFVKHNGGLSRYEKIRYFFHTIRLEEVKDREIFQFAARYSDLVKEKVILAREIAGARSFIETLSLDYNCAIVSGSDETELQEICSKRGIDRFFVEILGSPTRKEKNLANLIARRKWQADDCLYLGDSINDLKAARENNIPFIGFGKKGIEKGIFKNVRAVADFAQFAELSLDVLP